MQAESASSRRSWAGRALRLVGHGVVWLTIVGLVLAVAMLWRGPAVAQWQLRQQLQALGFKQPQLDVDWVSLTGAQFTAVSLGDGGIQAASIEVGYSPQSLWAGEIDHVSIQGLQWTVRYTDGRLHLNLPDSLFADDGGKPLTAFPIETLEIRQSQVNFQVNGYAFSLPVQLTLQRHGSQQVLVTGHTGYLGMGLDVNGIVDLPSQRFFMTADGDPGPHARPWLPLRLTVDAWNPTPATEGKPIVLSWSLGSPQSLAIWENSIDSADTSGVLAMRGQMQTTFALDAVNVAFEAVGRRAAWGPVSLGRLDAAFNATWRRGENDGRAKGWHLQIDPSSNATVQDLAVQVGEQNWRTTWRDIRLVGETSANDVAIGVQATEGRLTLDDRMSWQLEKPALDFKFDGQPANIIFAADRLAWLREGQVMAAAEAVRLPFSVGAGLAEDAPAFGVTVRLAQLAEDYFPQGEFETLQIAGRAWMNRGVLNFTADAELGHVPQATVSVQGSHDLLALGQGETQIEARADMVTVGRWLEAVGWLRDAAASGQVTLDATVGFDLGFTLDAIAKLHNVELSSNQYDVSLHGLNGTVRADSLLPFATPPRQELTVDSLQLGTLQLVDGRIVFSLQDTRELLVERTIWFWPDGGRFSVLSFRYEPGGPLDVELYVEDWNLLQYLEETTDSKIRGDGKVYGRIPVTYADGKIRIHEGAYLNGAPGGGTIQIINQDIRQLLMGNLLAALGENERSKLVAERLNEAAQDMRYDFLKIQVTRHEQGGKTCRIEIRGQGQSGAKQEIGSWVVNLNDYEVLLNQALLGPLNREALIDQALRGLFEAGGR